MELPILYNSRQEEFKKPFGTVKEGETVRIAIQIPIAYDSKKVDLVVEDDQGQIVQKYPLHKRDLKKEYEVWTVTFSLGKGLYYYYFSILSARTQVFVWKAGTETTLTDGGKWQLSAVTREQQVPAWIQGRVMYQIFPDRFYRKGQCILTEKLRPFSIHKNWEEEPAWRPDRNGRVLNNDFFGGNLRGIQEKLGYLQSLGVEILYLNPIVKAFSSHRYDTCDFKAVDPMLGTTEDFRALCQAVHSRDMRIILDGVFSHTGSDSIYFDRHCRFGNGAVSNPQSPYRKWYNFIQYPEVYQSWWGIDTLPSINKSEASYLEFLAGEDGGVVGHWLALGADGFRLDVVDELPDAFLQKLRDRIRNINPQAVLIGEVWEDASNKIAYGVRRRYFVDGLLDGVMNYPWRNAILRYVMGEDDGSGFSEQVMCLAENYPTEQLMGSMVSLSTHDTARVLTALADPFQGSREEKATRRLSLGERALAVERELASAFLQFFLPGNSCIYYGDEIEMEGFEDPFNRRTYPWGSKESQLLPFYKKLADIKKSQPTLQRGDIHVTGGNGRVQLRRQWQGQTVCGWLNLSHEPWSIEPWGEELIAYQTYEDNDQRILEPKGFFGAVKGKPGI